MLIDARKLHSSKQKTELKDSNSQILLQQKHLRSTLVKEDGDDVEMRSGSTSDPVILSEFSSPGSRVSLMSSAMSLRLRSGTETDCNNDNHNNSQAATECHNVRGIIKNTIMDKVRMKEAANNLMK